MRRIKMSDTPKEIRSKYTEVMPGVYELVPNEEYHASDGLSKTTICQIHESIALYQMMKASPQKPTDPMIKGSAFHDLVLLPGEYKKNYLVGPTIGKATKAHKQCVFDHPHKTVITSGTSSDIYSMRDALYDNPGIKKILDSKTTLREVSIWVKDPITGLTLKVRPDLISDGVIYDLKSTIAPHKEAFFYSIKKYNYHVQSSLYQDVALMNGMKITNFVFLVVGSKPPFLTASYDINTELLQEGRDKYREALTRYSNYLLSSDKWSGLSYGRETVTL